ncbi:MAG: HU family DNA-binding protein [Anaerovoracaceae bacterium]
MSENTVENTNTIEKTLEELIADCKASESKKVTFEELASIYAKKFDLSKKAAKDELKERFSFLFDLSKETEKAVDIPGVIKIELKHRSERMGKNPKTKEEILIEAKNYFKITAKSDQNDKIKDIVISK